MGRAVHLTELMDRPDVPEDQLAQSLRAIRGVNRYLGGTGTVLEHLRRYLRGVPTDQTITMLDVATGSADIPEAVLAWARRDRRRMRVIGLDVHPTTLKLAAAWTRGVAAGDGCRLDLVQADALRLPIADGGVDFATCCMFLHHLTDAAAARVVAELARVSRRGVIISDLRRNAWSRALFWLITIPAGRVDKHDARVSIAKAWTRGEIERVCGQVSWLKWEGGGGLRFVVAGRRGRDA